MSVWAEERRQGTEELLLTLPARDVEVVLGKYLAALGIYTAGPGLPGLRPDAASRLPRPARLGHPPRHLPRLLADGRDADRRRHGRLDALGNVTVAFILGALFCAIPVFAELLGRPLRPAESAPAVRPLSVPAAVPRLRPRRGLALRRSLLRRPGRGDALPEHGPARPPALGRRREKRGLWAHDLVRFVAVIVALASLRRLVAHAGWRPDLSPASQHPLSRIPASHRRHPDDRPVFIQALQPRGPPRVRRDEQDLINLLREIASLAATRSA